VKLGGLTVAATSLIGYPLALVYLGAGPRWQRVILFVVILPLLTSVVVRTFAWIVILGREGVINQAVLWLGLAPAPLRLLQTEHGLVIALTQIEMPIMLLPLLSVMSRLDPNLRDASAGLGASKWRTLVRVTLPLSLPGLVAGCMLVFASATTAFISQFVIGGNRLVYLPLIIWQQSLVVYKLAAGLGGRPYPARLRRPRRRGHRRRRPARARLRAVRDIGVGRVIHEFERRLCRRCLFLGEISEGAVEASSDD